MKFQFKEFRQILQLEPISAMANYLQNELAKSLRDLGAGLQRVNFEENFESFEEVVTLPASSTDFRIRNRLQKAAIPTKRFIVRGGINSYMVFDGESAWTKDYVYLANVHTEPQTVTVVFLK